MELVDELAGEVVLEAAPDGHRFVEYWIVVGSSRADALRLSPIALWC